MNYSKKDSVRGSKPKIGEIWRMARFSNCFRVLITNVDENVVIYEPLSGGGCLSSPVSLFNGVYILDVDYLVDSQWKEYNNE
jgi:hypothetical protein